MKNKLTIIMILTLLTCSTIPIAFGYNTGYQKFQQPTLTRIPMVCAIDPSDSSLSSGQSSLFMDVIKNGVSEWSNQLSQSMPHSKNWNIGYTEIPASQVKTFDYSLCDVVVITTQIPPSQSTCNSPYALGCEQYDGQYGFRWIRIFYDHYSTCNNPANGYSFCPSGSLTTAEFSVVFLHELGHALGLGHYVSDDPNVIRFWSQSPNTSPSIMIPNAEVNPDNQVITAMDIQKIHEMYNYDGFLAFVPKPSDNPFSYLTATPTIYNSDANVVKVTGSIAALYYNRGTDVEIIITDQSGKIFYDESMLITQDFQTNISSVDWPDGTYKMIAKYHGDQSSDVFFQIKNDLTNSNGQTSKIQTPNMPANYETSITLPYSITNGQVYGMTVNSQYGFLDISLLATGTGHLTIDIPRTLIDSKKSDGMDDKFTVSTGVMEGTYSEIGATDTDRSLTIPFTSGTQAIRIVGTQNNVDLYLGIQKESTVPEFGYLSGLIITLSATGVIFVSRYSGKNFQ